MLRSRANAIYFDAAQRVVAGLAIEQAALVKVVSDAAIALRKVQDLKKFLGVVASIISLASAIYAGNPSVILAAAKALTDDVG